MTATAGAPPEPLFVQVPGPAVGLDFVHANGMDGSLHLAEMMGGGGGFLDFDGDGDLDVYLVQSGRLGSSAVRGDRLFRSLLRETGSLAFEDVTSTVGLTPRGYGMGLAVGDYDGDGDPDVYLTNHGPNQLWRNDGDRWVEVGARLGVDDPRWSAAAAWFDADRDGDLDLYVGNYVDFSLANHHECHSASGAVDYCGPLAYRPQADRFYRQRSDGTFEDASVASGVGVGTGGALGVVVADLDGDRWLDLYVANDATANHLWLNQGDGTFRDDAVYAGCAVNGEGEVEGSMGVDAGDFDEDGDLDLFVTHISEETNTLYANDGHGIFTDVTETAGLGRPSRGRTGFGARWLDLDLDGRLDLAVANGRVRIDPEQLAAGEVQPLLEDDQLFLNLGGRFEDASARGGPAFETPATSRGLAVGDVDDDGDPDLLVAVNLGRPRLLLNQRNPGRAWLGLHLRTGDPAAEAAGATAILHFASGRSSMRQVTIDGSYCAAHDPRVLFAVAPEDPPTRLDVLWPDGGQETIPWDGRPLGRYVEIRQGSSR